MQRMYLVVICSTVSQAIVTARATGTGMTGTGAETEAGIETEIVNWADLKGRFRLENDLTFHDGKINGMKEDLR